MHTALCSSRARYVCGALFIVATLGLPQRVTAQVSLASTKTSPSPRDARDASGSVAGPTSAVAVRATHAPVIDGKGDDGIWATAQIINGFRTFDPVDNG